jgi:hypothetical protein
MGHYRELAGSSRRQHVALGVLVTLVAVYSSLASGLTPNALAASYHCWLPPGGTCDAPVSEAGPDQVFRIFTRERAGCIRVIGYFGEPQSDWHCFPKESWGLGFTRPNPSGGYNRSSLKNNNNTYWSEFGALTYP